MEDLKPIIAKNITALRQARKMTQIDLAEQLNYSDKAVSKWERGESVPDITVLKTIADLFGVTVDYLLQEEHNAPAAACQPCVSSKRTPTIITLLSMLLVWTLATLVYLIMETINPQLKFKWLPFLVALPVSAIVWLVFNSIWFNQRRNYLIISLLMWACVAMLVVMLRVNDLPSFQWLILGGLGQVGIVLWSHFRPKK